ncbi:MAG: cation:proton antiporter [Rhodothermaceae bacterium]|nr:cation:proton antiporter [Rhodothermaceae bacterium]
MPFFALLLVLVLAWGVGVLVGRLGYPPVLGELAAGVIFGPPVLGWVVPNEALTTLGSLGVVLLMLYIGMCVDAKVLARSASGALLPALAGLLIPMGLGYAAIVYVGGGDANAGLIVGVILGTTALATVSRILLDIDMLQSDLGQRLLVIALLEVILVLIAFAVSAGTAAMDMGMMDEAGGPHLVLLKAGGFLAGAVLVGYAVLPSLCRMMQGLGLTGGSGAFTFTVVVALIFAAASDAAGLSFVPGAFLAGLFIDKQILGDPFDTTVNAIRDVGVGFLAPIFFFTAGFQADLGFILEQPILLAAIVGAAFLGKVLAGILGVAPGRGTWREGAVVGFGMNGRGGIDVIMAGLALNSLHVIDEGLFTALVLTTFITTLPVPVLLQSGQRWLGAPKAAEPELTL